MIETIAILILLYLMLIMTAYATVVTLQLIFKGALTLAPWYLKAVAWFYVVSGSVASVLFIYGIVDLLLPIV